MGLIKTGLKAAVAVKVGHLVHDRIEARKQAEWEAQGNPPGTPAPGRITLPGAAPAITPVAAPAPGADDMLDRLTRLGELRAAGVLTDAEFEQQKARILAP